MGSDDSAYWAARQDVALLDMTLGALLDRQAVTFAERTAVVVSERDRGMQTRWTYAELRDRTRRLAKGLMAVGIQVGERVGVMSANRAEWILLEYALARIGAVLVTVNPALKAREVDYLLTQGRVNHLVFAARFRTMDIAALIAGLLKDAQQVGAGQIASARFPDLRGLIALDPGFGMALSFAGLDALADDVSDAALAARQAGVQPRDVMQIQYTSGTTGRPKGAMLTHHSTTNNARLMGQRAGFTPDDVLLSAMPLFHTAGCVCNVLGMLNAGGCVVVVDDFDPAYMLEQWERHRATIINGVPTMYSRLLDHPDFATRQTDSLRITFMGGTSIPPSLVDRFCTATGSAPMIIMGMTECSPIITQTCPGDAYDTRIATAGTPLPQTDIKIIDPATGSTVRWGAAGELCIRGYLLTKGYFDMPDATAGAIDADGWLHSGDLAVLDRSGHLQIVGRIKDMIIRGGENVFPVEIEDLLLEHPDVAQAQVVGVPDPDLGEEIFAFVLCRTGAVVSPDEIRAFCRANLARHKLPRYVHALAAFPMTANGKIQKFTLRDMALDLMKSDAI